MAAICVDVGTTLIKAVVFDDEGQELAVARQPTDVRHSRPGYSEQDMYAVWNAVVFSIRSVIRRFDEPVKFISLTAQGDGCWLVDRQGRPNGPAILWNDSRAKDIVAEWEQAGIVDGAFRLNGSAAFSGLPHAILAWLKREDPKRLENSGKALYCNGWIFFQLTGRIIVDDSDASAPFLEIRRRQYSRELLELYGLEWAGDLLPEVCNGQQLISALQPSAAVELGLKAGVPVVMAPYDVAAMAVGAGAVNPGEACSVLGTTICTEVVKTQADISGAPSGLTLSYVVPDLYLRAFPTLSGAEVFFWTQKLLDFEHPRDLGKSGSRVEVGSNGLLFLPYLSPSGERMPFFDPSARGTFFGLSFEHGRSHVARAVLEGLSMVIRDCLQAAGGSPNKLRLCGGGAKDEIWCQMIADATNLPACCTTDTEVGAKGAFITAMVLTGASPGFEQAAKDFVKLGAQYEPDRQRSDRYAQLFERFIKVREVAKEAWRQMENA